MTVLSSLAGNVYKFQTGSRFHAILWHKHLDDACRSNRPQVRGGEAAASFLRPSANPSSAPKAPCCVVIVLCVSPGGGQVTIREPGLSAEVWGEGVSLSPWAFPGHRTRSIPQLGWSTRPLHPRQTPTVSLFSARSLPTLCPSSDAHPVRGVTSKCQTAGWESDRPHGRVAEGDSPASQLSRGSSASTFPYHLNVRMAPLRRAGSECCPGVRTEPDAPRRGAAPA